MVKPRQLSSEEVKEWFAEGPAIPEETHGDWWAFSENRIGFRRGKEVVTVEVEWEENCPTCGGAYVKTWWLRVDQ